MIRIKALWLLLTSKYFILFAGKELSDIKANLDTSEHAIHIKTLEEFSVNTQQAVTPSGDDDEYEVIARPLNGHDLISAERRRQIEIEGWTSECDDKHADGQLSQAARCYELAALQDNNEQRSTWPWESAWWKPTTALRNFEKAGALYLAEVDRLLRAGKQNEAQVYSNKAEFIAEKIDALLHKNAQDQEKKEEEA